jgi:outer membrane protein insertion porin family
MVLLFIININASKIAKDVKLEGLTQISTKIANEILNIKKNDVYTDEQINKAIKEFYSFNYFNDIKVIVNNGILLLKFTEKPFIINLEVIGYKSRDDDLKSLFETMKIKKGNMYTKNKIQNAKKILLEQLEMEGYVHSVVETKIKTINTQSVSVTFDVNKGDEIIVNKINYIGAKSLNESNFEEMTANKEEDLVSWWFGQNDGVMQFSQLQYDSRRVKDIYFQNGYLDAKVSPAFSKIDFNTNKAEVDFNIKEGVQYKVNKITIFANEKIVRIKNLEEKISLKKK